MDRSTRSLVLRVCQFRHECIFAHKRNLFYNKWPIMSSQFCYVLQNFFNFFAKFIHIPIIFNNIIAAKVN